MAKPSVLLAQIAQGIVVGTVAGLVVRKLSAPKKTPAPEGKPNALVAGAVSDFFETVRDGWVTLGRGSTIEAGWYLIRMRTREWAATYPTYMDTAIKNKLVIPKWAALYGPSGENTILLARVPMSFGGDVARYMTKEPYMSWTPIRGGNITPRQALTAEEQQTGKAFAEKLDNLEAAANYAEKKRDQAIQLGDTLITTTGKYVADVVDAGVGAITGTFRALPWIIGAGVGVATYLLVQDKLKKRKAA